MWINLYLLSSVVQCVAHSVLNRHTLGYWPEPLPSTPKNVIHMLNMLFTLITFKSLVIICTTELHFGYVCICVDM